jgi:hypothetical protein
MARQLKCGRAGCQLLQHGRSQYCSNDAIIVKHTMMCAERNCEEMRLVGSDLCRSCQHQERLNRMAYGHDRPLPRKNLDPTEPARAEAERAKVIKKERLKDTTVPFDWRK